MINFLKKLANFFFGVIEALLIARFVLKLFGAEASSNIVQWIYEITSVFIRPFMFIFPTPSVNGEYVIEFTTLFAIFAYAFLGYLLQKFLGIFEKKDVKK